jgi:hypothetical protein
MTPGYRNPFYFPESIRPLRPSPLTKEKGKRKIESALGTLGSGIYDGGVSGSRPPLFQRKIYKGIIPTILVAIQAPGGDKTVLETLPAYYTYLNNGGFSKYTPDDFTGDLKNSAVENERGD